MLLVFFLSFFSIFSLPPTILQRWISKASNSLSFYLHAFLSFQRFHKVTKPKLKTPVYLFFSISLLSSVKYNTILQKKDWVFCTSTFHWRFLIIIHKFIVEKRTASGGDAKSARIFICVSHIFVGFHELCADYMFWELD